MITISAFKWVPPFAQGLVRDLRVRWALEETGLPYRQKLIDQEDQKSEAYRSLKPFGQVPTFEDGGLKLFESGSIVLHIAERFRCPDAGEPDSRSRVKMWLFTALNTVEPHVMYLA
jgi:glutathione S-transferase